METHVLLSMPLKMIPVSHVVAEIYAPLPSIHHYFLLLQLCYWAITFNKLILVFFLDFCKVNASVTFEPYFCCLQNLQLWATSLALTIISLSPMTSMTWYLKSSNIHPNSTIYRKCTHRCHVNCLKPSTGTLPFILHHPRSTTEAFFPCGENLTSMTWKFNRSPFNSKNESNFTS